MAAASFNFTPDKTAGVVDVEVADPEDDKTYPLLAVVHRLHLKKWDAGAGSYVLVDPIPNGESRHGVYVGSATKAGVSGRIKNHRDDPSELKTWMFAVVVYGEQLGKKSKKMSFDEAQGLECFLYEELESESVNLTNKNKPTEVPLTRSVQKKLQGFVDYVIELIKILGFDASQKPKSHLTVKIDSGYRERYSTETNGGKTNGGKTNGGKTNEKNVTVADLIQAGLIKVGTKLVPRPGKYQGEAKIVDEEGKIQILRRGKDDYLPTDSVYIYKTLGGANKAIAKFYKSKYYANGWDFWRLADNPKISMSDIRDEYRKQQS